jgi:ABC-type branched-subunit amino acid transport system substrate-binding protein
MRTSEPSAAKEVGNDVYDGVLFAVEQYEQTPGIRVNVTLETRDTEREPRLATKGAEELCDDKEVIGVIGPVFSTTVTSAAAVANARKVPLVTPTANAVGLASSGKYVFLANPDYDARGRAMARYAVVSRGFRTLAVLAPIDSYGKFLAEAFVREATRLGARVVATEWYQRGSSDLKQPLAKIRRAGAEAGEDARISFGGRTGQQTLLKLVHLGVSITRLDSLMSTGAAISAISLLGPRARFTLDSLGIPAMFDESRADSLEYPVDAIEALYVPIN